MEHIMKFRHFILLTVTTIIITACNFTLAEDITPPPNYVPPTPAPTLGPLYPAQAPSVENGALIYAEKCAPCHGATGLGDGEQGIQLGVTVPAFGLPELARPASPAQWFTTVTQGNMERFMPPFRSLNDQERWDVVAYALMFHTTDEQLEKGRELFEANCANCSTDFFKDQAKMSALSEVELARIVKQGNEAVQALGSTLTDDEVWAIAAYLRTLSFDTASIASASTPLPTAEAVTVTETPVSAETGIPTEQGQPVEGTAQAQVPSEAEPVLREGFGNVSGSIVNNTGADLPSDLKVTLHGLDHGADPSAGPQEVLTLDGRVNANGTFVFKNIEASANRIYIAEITFEGITLQSDFAVVPEGATDVSLPPITLYHLTEDTSALVIDEARIFFEYGSNKVQVFNVYLFRNPSDEIIVVKLNENSEVPFIKPPEGSSDIGYEPMQDTERLVATDNGFAVPPSEGTYGLIAFGSLATTEELNFSQQFVLPAATVSVFLPEGVRAENSEMTDLGVQPIQGFNFQIYEVNDIGAGDKVAFTISGSPLEASAASPEASTTPNQNLLIGAGALGIALILAGAWMYLRDRNRVQDEDEEQDDEFDSAEDAMDAIIALDDLHRAKKISDEAYQKRRAQLKEILKGMM